MSGQVVTGQFTKVTGGKPHAFRVELETLAPAPARDTQVVCVLARSAGMVDELSKLQGQNVRVNVILFNGATLNQSSVLIGDPSSIELVA